MNIRSLPVLVGWFVLSMNAEADSARAAQRSPTEVASLRANQITNDFAVRALYLDDLGRPAGAQLIHTKTGFELRLIYTETVPQAWLWVNTFPESDRGEPHTQEHLLLLKGERGRALKNFESMTLTTSTAFTSQWRTSYLFHTVADVSTFYRGVEEHLEAMIRPDYSDEEIRREVAHFGIVKQADGSLSLEEKGTIYNEMTSTYSRPPPGPVA